MPHDRQLRARIVDAPIAHTPNWFGQTVIRARLANGEAVMPINPAACPLP